MTRYVSAPKPKGDSFWDDRMVQPLGHPQVFVSEPIDTGLLDRDGSRLYRLPDAIGFLPKPEQK